MWQVVLVGWGGLSGGVTSSPHDGLSRALLARCTTAREAHYSLLTQRDITHHHSPRTSILAPPDQPPADVTTPPAGTITPAVAAAQQDAREDAARTAKLTYLSHPVGHPITAGEIRALSCDCLTICGWHLGGRLVACAGCRVLRRRRGGRRERRGSVGRAAAAACAAYRRHDEPRRRVGTLLSRGVFDAASFGGLGRWGGVVWSRHSGGVLGLAKRQATTTRMFHSRPCALSLFWSPTLLRWAGPRHAASSRSTPRHDGTGLVGSVCLQLSVTLLSILGATQMSQ